MRRRRGAHRPSPSHAAAGVADLEDEPTTCHRAAGKVALRFRDPLGRRDASGRAIPHELVVFGDLADEIESVEDGLQQVWPLVAEAYAGVWDPSDHPRLATSRFAAKDNRSPDAPRSVGSDRGDNDWVDPCQELLAPLEPTRMMRNIPGADDAAIGEVRRVAPVAGGKRRESAGRRRAGRTAVVTDVATGSPIRARSPFRARARRQVRPSRGPACGWWVVGWRRRGR